ncbi:MAG: hypothetical protein ACHQUA_02855 [Microgenomates group bacterium]
MTEASGKSKPTSDESLIMQGLVSRIIDEAAQGKTDTPILDIAQRIKTDALDQLDLSQADNKKFVEACNTVIGFIEEHPDKTVLDIFKEHPKKP